MKFAFIANLGEKVTVNLLSFNDPGEFTGRTTIYESDGGVMKPVLSQDGSLVAISAAQKDNVTNSTIFVINTQTCEVVKKYFAGEDAFTYPHMFLPNSTKIVISIERRFNRERLFLGLRKRPSRGVAA